MKIVQNNSHSNIGVIAENEIEIDEPFKLPNPLPKAGFFMYIVGTIGSGKTNLCLNLLLQKKKGHKFYNGYFDKLFVVSGSLPTLPIDVMGIPDEQIYQEYSDELLKQIIKMCIEDNDTDHNHNVCLFLDDNIRNLNRSKILTKTILNRRHLIHDPSKKGRGTLSIIITSQKYNGLQLYHRANCSHVAVFRTNNCAELNAIKSEIMGSMDNQTANELLEVCWDRPYGFMFCCCTKPKDERYYSNFDLVKINSDNDD